MMIKPKLLALDFDGVICNGLQEYFHTSQKTYQKIWGNPLDRSLAETFDQLRPVIEYGWEMPILLRALILNYTPENILDNWSNIAQAIVTSENLIISKVTQELDQIRDEWIKSDLDSWLALQIPYPQIIEILQSLIESPIILYIISTKEGRFIQEFCQKYQLNLPSNYIIGKECKRPKSETLRLILAQENVKPEEIWFIEDRLNTLNSIVKQPDLTEIKLFLADWGYNTESMRNSIKNHPRIQLLSLEQFSQFWQV